MASRKTGNVAPKEDSRLSRIRDNQRRSRARRREYLEELEGRWKKCQELGVQANVELQRAAKRVIEENNLLRTILMELGLEKAQVDKRLRQLKGTGAINDDSYNLSGDNGCDAIPVGGLDGTGTEDMVTPLEGSQLPQPPSESAPLGEDNEGISVELPGTSIDTTAQDPINYNMSQPALHDSILDMNLLEAIPDFENNFDITQFLELFDTLPSRSSSIGPIDQQASSGPSPLIDETTAQLTLANINLPQTCSSGACTSKLKATTPCTEAYALLKALSAQRQEHQDMLQIVLELWNGFCYPDSGEGDDGKGCRVDNDILQQVIDGLKQNK